MNWSSWLPAVAVPLLIAGASLIFQDALKAALDKFIGHRFDRKLEALRSELRKSEESFIADLKTKESEIDALRAGALSGLAGRQTQLDKRRVEAVEQLWSAVIALRPLITLSAIMSAIDFEKAVKTTIGDQQQQAAFAKLFKPFGLENLPGDTASKERPFLTPIVWALFSAYQMILLYAVTQAHVLKFGMDGNLLNQNYLKDLMKTLLPHRVDYIEKYGSGAGHHLLSEIETKLLEELKNMLMGVESDGATVRQASEILRLANEVHSAKSTLAEVPLELRRKNTEKPEP